MKNELVIDGENRLLNRPLAEALVNQERAMQRAMRRPIRAVVWTMMVIVGACVVFVMLPLDLDFWIPFGTIMGVIALSAALLGAANSASRRVGRRYVICCGSCGAPVLDPASEEPYRHVMQTGNCRKCGAQVLEQQ